MGTSLVENAPAKGFQFSDIVKIEGEEETQQIKELVVMDSWAGEWNNDEEPDNKKSQKLDVGDRVSSEIFLADNKTEMETNP